jgi:hypothetical protein
VLERGLTSWRQRGFNGEIRGTAQAHDKHWALDCERGGAYRAYVRLALVLRHGVNSCGLTASDRSGAGDGTHLWAVWLTVGGDSGSFRTIALPLFRRGAAAWLLLGR